MGLHSDFFPVDTIISHDFFSFLRFCFDLGVESVINDFAFYVMHPGMARCCIPLTIS